MTESYYQIFSPITNELVIRKADETTLGLSIRLQDQDYINAVIEEVQRACEFFYLPFPPAYPGCPEIQGISDAEVKERIQRFDQGENFRESERLRQPRYPLQQLPADRQRALIERIERIKAKWQFRKLTEEQAAALLHGEPPAGSFIDTLPEGIAFG